MTTTTKQEVDLDTGRDYGVVIKPDTIRFERVLPGPVERVWSYFTSPTNSGNGWPCQQASAVPTLLADRAPEAP